MTVKPEHGDINASRGVRCGDCLNFRCLNKHGRGAGLCKVGASFYGLWADSIHECEAFVKQERGNE